jgi:hypothetical protein
MSKISAIFAGPAEILKGSLATASQNHRGNAGGCKGSSTPPILFLSKNRFFSVAELKRANKNRNIFKNCCLGGAKREKDRQ